jgi:hypothetical protein
MKTLFAGILIGFFFCCGLYFIFATFGCNTVEAEDYITGQDPITTRLARTSDNMKNLEKYELKVATQINLLQSRILALESALKSHRITVPDSNTPFEPILIHPMPGATRDIFGRLHRNFKTPNENAK